MKKMEKNVWPEVSIESILLPNSKGVTLSQGWSPQCEKYSSTSENDWGVLKTTAIQFGYFLEEENKFLPKHLEPRPQHEVKEGDLLITCAGPRNRCGVACLVRKTRKKLMISGKMYRFRIDEEKALSEFVELYLLSHKAWKAVDLLKTGGSDSGLNLTHTRFKTLSIPLPSIKEQSSIITKVKELFSNLENGKYHLLTAQAKLITYRQSLLKSAFEGHFTNKNLKVGELPKDWEVKKLGEVCELYQPKTISTKELKPNGEYLVYGANGIIGKYDKYNHEESQLLITCRGASCGSVNISVPKAWINGNAMVVRPKYSFLDLRFLTYFFRNGREITKTITGSAQPQITRTTLSPLKIPVPPITDQREIVAILESKLAICNNIEETINTALEHIETLRQSILKKAFEGKLIKPKQEILDTYKPRNEHFYQMQLMGWVLAISKQKKIQHSEMTSVKYIYLIDRVFGIPTFYEFKRGNLGPFPAAIKKAINNTQYFKKTGGHIEVINENTLFKSVNPYTEKAKKAVNEIAEFFSKYNAKERAHKTELLATICKVIEDIQTTDLESVRNSMKEWSIELKNQPNSTKAAKFSEEETSKCLQFIKEKGWDQKILKKNE